MQFAELEVVWMVENMDKDQHGDVFEGLRVDGIYFDADPYFAEVDDLDVDNDLVPDGGFGDGVNLWGKGMEELVSQLSEMIPEKMIIGGDRYAGGICVAGVAENRHCRVSKLGGQSVTDLRDRTLQHRALDRRCSCIRGESRYFETRLRQRNRRSQRHRERRDG